MDSLKEKIVEKLESLPEIALQEVLEFLDFVVWRNRNRENSSLSVSGDDLREEQDAAWLETDLSNLGSYDPYDWEPGEMGEGVPVKYVPGMGVVIVEE
jgi:hypothetical protein